MNQKDRSRLARLLGCMSRLPWPNRNKTLMVGDYSRFLHRMEELQLLFTEAIMCISRCDVEDPELALQELEKAIKQHGSDKLE
jgi:hypothetical protein